MFVSRRIKPYALLFIGLSIIYHSNLRPIPAGDSLPSALLPFSVLLDHTVSLDRWSPWMVRNLWWGQSAVEQHRGHWYSSYPIGGPILVIPLYLPALAFPSLRDLSPPAMIAVARVVEKFVAVILAAAAAVWMLILLERLVPSRWAWILMLVFALCTATWSISSQALWQHAFDPLAIITCFYGLVRWETGPPANRWMWVCGIGAGLALFIRPTNVLLLPAVAFALWIRRSAFRNYVRLAIPACVAAAPLVLYNWLVFERLTGGYTWDDGHLLRGAVGLLVSPGRGLLIYTPILFFALTAFAPSARDNLRKRSGLVAACGLFSILQFLTIAEWRSWWGGFCWVDRYLAEIIVPMIILIAIGLPVLQSRRWRVGFASVAVYCFLIQALGVYFYPNGHWDGMPVSIDVQPARAWNWADNPIIRTARAGPVWQPYVIVGTALTEGLPAAGRKLKQFGINPSN